jgi:hypothetical protein
MTIARILAAKGRDVVTTQPHRTLAEVAEVRRSISIRKGRHFDGEIIIVYVRWYLRFKVSFRDLVEMMAERGICLAHTTIIDLQKTAIYAIQRRSLGAEHVRDGRSVMISKIIHAAISAASFGWFVSFVPDAVLAVNPGR